MEFRAQVEGRAQRQRIKKPKPLPPGWKSDIHSWIDQWTERVDATSPYSSEGLHIVDAQIDWRLISNSGTDDGIIRPVIGAGGWPLLPGSGIKGLFRRACSSENLERWCGSPCANGDLSPGVLRFHGAWPADASWTHALLDLAHPQQNWQVGFTNGGESHSAFGVVSLYKPLLKIGLSSTRPLSDSEWDAIKATMKRALERGLGGRTCAGYGSSGTIDGDVIFRCGLEGQGPAAKLLDDTAEFRPTMFRAAIRGMALRVFGGLTDERTALQVVGELFGSLSREEGQNVGLLATAYTDSSPRLGEFGSGGWKQPVYATRGELQWRLARALPNGQQETLLAELLGQLHGLVMTLGGFGRGWRRPDHRIFRPDYTKTPIGCHWQWLESRKVPAQLHVQSAADLEALFQWAQSSALRWLAASNRGPGQPAPWREAFAPNRFGVWLREAQGPADGEVIAWFHDEPKPDRQGNKDPRDLKKTDLGGRVNLVGSIWNRMLPLESGIATSPSAPAGLAAGRSTPGGAFARPSAKPAAARSGTATARPPRPGSRHQAHEQQPASVSVSIEAWPGPYLESVVLFLNPRDRGHAPALAQKLNEGAGAGFRRISLPRP